MTVLFIVITIICSAIDLILSFKSLSSGDFSEANPIMRACLLEGPELVIFVKISATALYSWVILRIKKTALAVNCSAAVACLYLLLMFHWLMVYSPCR